MKMLKKARQKFPPSLQRMRGGPKARQKIPSRVPYAFKLFRWPMLKKVAARRRRGKKEKGKPYLPTPHRTVLPPLPSAATISSPLRPALPPHADRSCSPSPTPPPPSSPRSSCARARSPSHAAPIFPMELPHAAAPNFPHAAAPRRPPLRRPQPHLCPPPRRPASSASLLLHAAMAPLRLLHTKCRP